jgi:hypothetical protein
LLVQITAARFSLDHINLQFPHHSNESQWLQSITQKLHWSAEEKRGQSPIRRTELCRLESEVEMSAEDKARLARLAQLPAKM